MAVEAVINESTLVKKEIQEQKKTPIIQKVLVMLGMVSLMGGTITGTMTYPNLGFTETFFFDWATNFFTALVTVIPVGFTMMALLTKGAEKLLPNMAAKARDALVGVIMALIMESGMAFTSAYNSVGLDNQSEFVTAWMDGVLGALPVALVLMITVSMTIKPKVERFLKS
ncbi:TPA: DUF2798 domain-containing protein [Vibrio vulnificus]|uniref:DUF2798 domain-containing protein n=1 Tax=Vibrio vulnificus TaxID=672 RepID=UPI0019D4CAC9|nr:DUF2798 domain-containing protein [Vibrio vulnificus]MBN8143375.1 DUF2798 domain-containing protein [Vibrio vulnificus]HAS6160102.1 DUF2798 domain-containing protein [Vibrio vulnificus]HAS6249565.1 DUF2798 domain-containing protein [Vibrio vulnificus]HAT8485490.1 DUF2798 domain-containing protein [Vibrio vulnificus]HAT8514823.1 DUF2798 domain-containing protein [Vibrio vulnificus]